MTLRQDNLYLEFQRWSRDEERVLIRLPNGGSLSYGDMDRRTAKFSGLLKGFGLKPGDRVAAQTGKSADSLFLYLACLRGGVVYVPLNTGYRGAELKYLIGDSKPSLVVCDPYLKEQIAPAMDADSRLITLGRDGEGTLCEATRDVEAYEDVVRVGDHQPAAIIYTSGTTGKPKGAVLTHGNLKSNGYALARLWGFHQDDVLLHVLPLFHVHGLFVACHCVLLSGAALLLAENADTRELVRQLRSCTVLMGVPTHYTRLINDSRFSASDCKTLRLFVSGSAPLKAQSFEDFERRTGHRILERYGMTETVINTSNPLQGERVPGSIGLPLPGVELRIADEDNRALSPGEVGMLQVKGPNVFAGYWNKPDETRLAFTDDGYFITGDLGSCDRRGYIYLTGRQKDLIISGGYNVYPVEVELCIDALPGIRESAVIGLPHPDLGEAVTAVVVPEEPEANSEVKIIDALRDRIASYKRPKSVQFVEELPRNTMGKVQKNRLRERFQNIYL